jgi:hypothetical protein
VNSVTFFTYGHAGEQERETAGGEYQAIILAWTSRTNALHLFFDKA